LEIQATPAPVYSSMWVDSHRDGASPPGLEATTSPAGCAKPEPLLLIYHRSTCTWWSNRSPLCAIRSSPIAVTSFIVCHI
jgi:hypothetical protein